MLKLLSDELRTCTNTVTTIVVCTCSRYISTIVLGYLRRKLRRIYFVQTKYFVRAKCKKEMTVTDFDFDFFDNFDRFITARGRSIEAA